MQKTLTTDENVLIIQKVYEDREIVLGKLTNKLTNKKKKEEWQKIADFLTTIIFVGPSLLNKESSHILRFNLDNLFAFLD